MFLFFGVQFLYYYKDFDPLPQFCNLSRLKAEISLYFLEILPTILESCPNLKSLVMVLVMTCTTLELLLKIL